VERGAFISPDGLYRYWLWRHWGKGVRRVLFIMLNPSTADALIDDPTIEACIAFAMLWDFDGLEVCNAFAFRATKPIELQRAVDPVGMFNNGWIIDRANHAELIVCAWGNHATFNGRNRVMLELLKSYPLHTLRISKDGHPGHPLYIARNTPLVSYAGVR